MPLTANGDSACIYNLNRFEYPSTAMLLSFGVDEVLTPRIQAIHEIGKSACARSPYLCIMALFSGASLRAQSSCPLKQEERIVDTNESRAHAGVIEKTLHVYEWPVFSRTRTSHARPNKPPPLSFTFPLQNKHTQRPEQSKQR